MTKWVAFLRGVNVGGHRKLPMADLRRICVGKTSDPTVRTYIASGNVVFQAEGAADALADMLAQAIKDEFGFDVPTLVLSEAAMRAILASCPCPDAPGNFVHAYLCYKDPVVDQAGINALCTLTETVTVIGRTVWLHAPDGIGRSKLATKMEKLIGVEATARNLNTVRKMVALLDA